MGYICPLCQQALSQDKTQFFCPNNHHFDIAKEGYINLLPVQKKHSKDPGDNKEMMLARRAFLSSDHYLPMRDQVIAYLKTATQSVMRPKILDLGCGEGYYTQGMVTALDQAQIYGLDISKVAIRYSAKRYHHIHFCVASNYSLPFAQNSFDAMVRIYAPCEHSEILRTLKPEGVLITVTPAARHLYQLKELVYSDVHLHDNTPEEIPGLNLIQEKNLHYTMLLSGEEAENLLQMTPFAWKATPEVKRNLLNIKKIEVEADFNIRLFSVSAEVSIKKEG